MQRYENVIHFENTLIFIVNKKKLIARREFEGNLGKG